MDAFGRASRASAAMAAKSLLMYLWHVRDRESNPNPAPKPSGGLQTVHLCFFPPMNYTKTFQIQNPSHQAASPSPVLAAFFLVGYV